MAKTAKSSGSKTNTRKTKPKPVPAVRYLRYQFQLGTPNTEQSYYIDLARDLSAVNRRLMRQGRNYHIKSVSFISRDTPNSGNYVQLCTVPDSWSARGAWRRGFQLHNSMVAAATDKNFARGKWDDFKVYMDVDMRTAAGLGTLLVPKDSANNNVSLGEWTYAKYVAPTAAAGVADEYNAHFLGDHGGAAGAYTSIGLIKSYGEGRATVNQSPRIQTNASDDPLVNLFDHGDTVNDILDNMENDADDPPYDIDNYGGDDANMPKAIVVKQTALVDGKASVGGFSALCGLLEVEAISALENDTITMIVELKEGNYRGIAAEVI